MAINFKEYKPNIAERSTTTYKIESPPKVTVDNSHSVGYNGSKETNSTITPSTDYSKQWLDKNQGLLKYAGDSAKKSIHAGLDEAPSFMRDADEGTNFEDVQTASVKRHLAKDANDNKLHNSALMEMIGHLSKDNKGPYLKHTLPLHTYIDAKDMFDFMQNNYTTTKNIDTTPDEKVRQLQRELNEAGYTDKVGQRLIEDGVYGGKTAYADDSKKANGVTSSNNYNSTEDIPLATDIEYTDNTDQNKRNFSIDDLTYEDYLKIAEYLGYDEKDLQVVKIDITDDGMVRVPQSTASLSGPMGPVYEPVANILNNSENIKVASLTGTGEKGILESVGYNPPKTSDGGKLSDGDDKYSETKQTMIKCLSGLWMKNHHNEIKQLMIHSQADKLRNFNDNSFHKAILLNNSSGASNLGHNAVMLVNKEGYGIIFSVFSSSSNLLETLWTDAELRFSVLSPQEVDKLTQDNGEKKLITGMPATDGDVKYEYYDNSVVFNISVDQGKKMYEFATSRYEWPNLYMLLTENCDHFTVDCFKQAGIKINKDIFPNDTYENATKI